MKDYIHVIIFDADKAHNEAGSRYLHNFLTPMHYAYVNILNLVLYLVP